MITLDKAREISMERIAELEPDFRARVRQWMDRMFASGNPILIAEGFRSIDRSNHLVEQGILAAPGGKSYHNYGLAVDWVALVPHPKALGMFQADEDKLKNYVVGIATAVEFNLSPISVETGHLQDGRYPTWREAKAARETKESQS
jgi:hypothetical protein